jgi:hypothetical protein
MNGKYKNDINAKLQPKGERDLRSKKNESQLQCGM